MFDIPTFIEAIVLAEPLDCAKSSSEDCKIVSGADGHSAENPQ